MSENRFEYEGPLSVSFSHDGYGEVEVGDYGERRFDGDDLAYVIADMIGGKRDDHVQPYARVVKRVRVVVEVLDAEEHKPPPPPEGQINDGVDFDPPAPPEVP